MPRLSAVGISGLRAGEGVKVSEGVVTPDDEGPVFAQLTDALLDVEGLTGNAFLAPNVVSTLNVLPRYRTFVHGRAEPAAFVELKLPAVACALTATNGQAAVR
ncbi:hypothetical protein [Burkholderia sp. LMG 32019]|uniref:hypothetical protein n=1 Tax=Burkholderia sp. LMG 32019 TaxID=3158173 RepID=UPI003C2BC74C